MLSDTKYICCIQVRTVATHGHIPIQYSSGIDSQKNYARDNARDILWPPKVTLGRLLPHVRGLGFKSRRGGFPSGAKKEWGLSPKANVRVFHTAQLDVTEGVIFAYEADRVQQQFASFVIQEDVSTSSAPSSSSMSSNTSIFHTLRQESVKRSRSDNTGNNKFMRYTGTDCIISMEQEEFNNFDILSWGKGRQSQFPVLSIMARDLLSVQASTIASESAFSLSGRVLSIRRTKLTPASLEMCICLKDHLDAQERIQDTSNLEGDCLEIEQQLHEVEAKAGYVINIADEEIILEE
nr:zinc finger BED domain-containing protein RICESLEEPER 2-like [Tanacetum cinerariifolium]